MNRDEIAEAARTLDHLGMTAMFEENKRQRELIIELRLRLSECADELTKLDHAGDAVTRTIRTDARTALAKVPA